MKERDEQEYDDEYSWEDPSLNTFDREEEEYLLFLEEFGHIDFTLLTFSPMIQSVDDIKIKRNDDIMNTTRYVRTKELIAACPGAVHRTVTKYSEAKGKDVFNKDKEEARMKIFKKETLERATGIKENGSE